jgi:hypothetical protein
MANAKPLIFYWRNILLLALGLFIFNAWAARIFGDQVKNFVWTNGILAVLAIAGFFLKYFTESEKAQLQSRVRELLYVFVSNRFLVWFYLIFFVISSFLTSVVIESRMVNDPLKTYVSIVNYDANPRSREINKEVKSTRFIQFAHPFGRRFIVSADGYSEKSYRVFPWFGRKVNLEDDLKPVLTLWIRMPSTLVNTLLDQCRLVICHDTDTLYNIQTEKGFGSLLIGRKIPISEERLKLWEREASVFFDVDGSDLDLVLLGWQSIKHLEPQAEIEANDELKFILTHASGALLANTVHRVSEGSIIDVLLK